MLDTTEMLQSDFPIRIDLKIALSVGGKDLDLLCFG